MRNDQTWVIHLLLLSHGLWKVHSHFPSGSLLSNQTAPKNPPECLPHLSENLPSPFKEIPILKNIFSLWMQNTLPFSSFLLVPYFCFLLQATIRSVVHHATNMSPSPTTIMGKLLMFTTCPCMELHGRCPPLPMKCSPSP